MIKALQRKKKQPKRADSDGNFITNAGRIASLLHQASKAPILFNAKFKTHGGPFNTAVMRVKEEENYIILDEITPKESHQLFLSEKRIRMLGYLHGVEMSFETELLDHGIHEGIRFYKTTMPEKLFYLQRRADHRVPTTGIRIPFQARRANGLDQYVHGYLSDLSLGGIGIILEEATYLRPGDTLPTCTITLPNEAGDVIFSLEIRFASKAQYKRRVRLGGAFQKLDRDSKQKIRKLINELERAQLKRLRGG
ncbi:MAG: flagellar regulator YcgR PilZN domain-containing protein [Sedimenticola sp.]